MCARRLCSTAKWLAQSCLSPAVSCFDLLAEPTPYVMLCAPAQLGKSPFSAGSPRCAPSGSAAPSCPALSEFPLLPPDKLQGEQGCAVLQKASASGMFTFFCRDSLMCARRLCSTAMSCSIRTLSASSSFMALATSRR